MAAANAKWGVLAYLRRHPSHGYMVYTQLAAIPSWDLARSTVYDALDRLEKKGLIEPVPGQRALVNARSRGGMRYRLTHKGTDDLDGFLAGLDLVEAPRHHFVLAVQIATWAGPQATLELLDRLEHDVNQRLDEMRPAPRPERLTELGEWGLVKDEQHALHGRLAWIETMREATRELCGPDGGRR